MDYGNITSWSGLFYSSGKWFAGSFGVRPVVYLNSEITVEDLHVINGQEDDWSTYSNDFTVAHGGTDNGEAGNYGTPGRPPEYL